MIKGFATPEGTKKFKEKFVGELDETHFREKLGLWLSSIGIGSYLGDPESSIDQKYIEAFKKAAALGVNVFDSAINYRHQRSERALGKALSEMILGGTITREEVLICTKGGFIPFDEDYPDDPAAYFAENYLDKGIVAVEEVVENCHILTPSYIEDQFEKSLKNLNLETLDVYYVHNPEMQLSKVDRRQFLNQMKQVFEMLERKISEGKLKYYGTATWDGYRVLKDDQAHLSLEELTVIAREVAGAGHHFKFVQLPFNLAMPEAWVVPTQPFAANSVPFLGVAERLGVVAIGSASLLQSRLTGPFPDHLEAHFGKLKLSSQRAIQFARSVPGMGTALVGMKELEHVQENLETAKVKTLTSEELINMFQGGK